MPFSAIFSVVTDLLGKIIAPLFAFIERWRAERTARQLGEQTQRATDAVAGLDEARKANEARTGGRSDAELDQLLK